MSEYISREELIDRLRKTELTADQIRMLVYPREAVVGAIYDCPPADVRENIHAAWEDTADPIDSKWGRKYYQCPKCSKRADYFMGGSEDWWCVDKPNFCPSCGAIMDGEPKDTIHKAIDNTTFAEEAYPNIKEELHKAVDMAEPKEEKGET